jgi:hypothetical protein
MTSSASFVLERSQNSRNGWVGAANPTRTTRRRPLSRKRQRLSSTLLIVYRSRPILSPFRPPSSIGRSIMREIVHIQAGQCGNQIGAKFWEVRNKEPIGMDGWMDDPRVVPPSRPRAPWRQSSRPPGRLRQQCPRNLMFDVARGLGGSPSDDSIRRCWISFVVIFGLRPPTNEEECCCC